MKKESLSNEIAKGLLKFIGIIILGTWALGAILNFIIWIFD